LRLVALLGALALAGCAGGDENGDLVVFAAASLADVAPAVDSDATVILGGSNDLAAQIWNGADVDVLLSASLPPIEALSRDGMVDEIRAFASNRLVLVVPKENDADIRELGDLTGAGVKLVLGARGVPIGEYARAALDSAGLREALAQVVSLEDDVKGVLSKVALGEADAGIVYATDVEAVRDDVQSFPIPDEFQPKIRYYAALVSPGSEAGRAYLERLLGPEGARALRDAGFLPLST
jgi:molybdate transport system substrate-binding protein